MMKAISAMRPLLQRSGRNGMAFLYPAGIAPLLAGRFASKAAVSSGMGTHRALASSSSFDTEERSAVLQKASAKDDSPTAISGAQRTSFRIESERELFRRYQTVWERNIRFPNGKLVSYDVLGNDRSDFQSVFVFPFDSSARTVTVLREYCPGVNAEQLSFVAGMFESDKHASLEEAARAELSEEAHLTGGKLVRLCENHDGISADKYSRNKFHYFLCMDSEKDKNPRDKDIDEWITIEAGKSLGNIRQMISGGLFNTPSSLLGMLALDELRRMGYE